jgi:ATP-dependent Lon protease
VLLPGVILSVPILNRPDIASLLALVLTRANIPRPDPVSIGCVPLSSQLVNSAGQSLIKGAHDQSGNWADVPASEARKEDLFRYGTVARISAVHGGLSQDAVLVLEGMKRFRINKIKQRRPFFEADVTYIDEQGWECSASTSPTNADS